MPRYFFHLRDGTSSRDQDGTELADLREAKSQAAKFVGRCLQVRSVAFWTEAEWQLEVAADRDLTLVTMLIWGFGAPAETS